MARGLLSLALALTSSTAFAHDYWMEPSLFRPDPGQLVWITHFVGQRFRGDAVPRDPSRLLRFVERTVAGDADVRGFAEPSMPAGFVRPGAPGLHWIGFESDVTAVELDPATFAEYLAEEGLESVAADRAARGEQHRPVREAFSRCAKLAFAAGAVTDTAPDPDLGLTLELVPLVDPRAARPGAAFVVELRFRGQPRPGALVVAREKSAPDETVSARTDASGRAALVLPRAGAWMLKSTQMERADAGRGADWRSFWASLTFELAPR